MYSFSPHPTLDMSPNLDLYLVLFFLFVFFLNKRENLFMYRCLTEINTLGIVLSSVILIFKTSLQ